MAGAGGADSPGQLLLLFYDLSLWAFANIHKSKGINVLNPLYSPPSVNHYQCTHTPPCLPYPPPPGHSNLSQAVFDQQDTQLPYGFCSLPRVPHIVTCDGSSVPWPCSVLVGFVQLIQRPTNCTTSFSSLEPRWRSEGARVQCGSRLLSTAPWPGGGGGGGKPRTAPSTQSPSGWHLTPTAELKPHCRRCECVLRGLLFMSD